jgi:hypothetical protein
MTILTLRDTFFFPYWPPHAAMAAIQSLSADTNRREYGHDRRFATETS